MDGRKEERLKSVGGGRGGGRGILPDAAFGPPGRIDPRTRVSSGDTNLSIIATPVPPNFSLRKTLGPPREAAEFLLRTSIAPGGSSGRFGTLLNACEEQQGGSGGDTTVTGEDNMLYRFDYRVERVRPRVGGGDTGIDDASSPQLSSLPTLRAIAIVAVTANTGDKVERTLVTATVVAPEAEWDGGDGGYGRKLKRVAESFRLTR